MQLVTEKLPLMTYMQISDLIQEFLCLDDQIKLMSLDKDRLE